MPWEDGRDEGVKIVCGSLAGLSESLLLYAYKRKQHSTEKVEEMEQHRFFQAWAYSRDATAESQETISFQMDLDSEGDDDGSSITDSDDSACAKYECELCCRTDCVPNELVMIDGSGNEICNNCFRGMEAQAASNEDSDSDDDSDAQQGVAAEAKRQKSSHQAASDSDGDSVMNDRYVSNH